MPPHDDPLRLFVDSLTTAAKAQIHQDATALAERLLAVTLDHCREHPHIPHMVWLLAIAALLDAWQDVASQALAGTGEEPLR